MARLIAAFLLVLTVPLAAQNEERYRARLAPVPMDIAMRSAVAGSGTATGTLKGMLLTVSGTFEGLRSPATTARLHFGDAMGLRGVPFADLVISKSTSGTISGPVTLDAEQKSALQKRHVYIQISSERAPDGNLWGWFVR